MTDVAGNTYYNDWVELYMFSNYGTSLDNQYPRNYTAVNGDVYAQSRVLIGMWDKDATDLKHFNTWNFEKLRREYREVSADYEHGNSGFETLFDHDNKNKVPVYASKFRVNGDVWLWEDARIENFDSTRTYNAYKGVKNNIYAMQDLYIDGYCYQGSSIVDYIPNASCEVSIFGDVMVQGELYIANSVVFGDIYCNGPRLTMVDCTVYGNVYFAGGEFTAENTTITAGYFDKATVMSIPSSMYDTKILSSEKYVKDDANATDFPSDVSYAMPGGNLVIMNGANGNATQLPSTTSRGYGAVLTNCAVTGTLYANTSLYLASAHPYYDVLGGAVYKQSKYNNVICKNNKVKIDLSHYYEEGYKATEIEAGSDRSAARCNKIEINGVLMADSLTFSTSSRHGAHIIRQKVP